MIHIKYVTRALINYPWLPQVKPELLLNFQIRNILPWQSEWQWFQISSCGGILIRENYRSLTTLQFSKCSELGSLGQGNSCALLHCVWASHGWGVPELCSRAVMFSLMILLSAVFLWSYNWNQKSFLEEGELYSEINVYPWDTIVLWNEFWLFCRQCGRESTLSDWLF